MIKDSCFAKGLGMVVSKVPARPEMIGNNNRDFELLKYLDEAEGLTLSVIAELLECSRKTADKTAMRLLRSTMIKCITVAGQQDVFKLWVLSNKRLPKTPNEACRLSALSLFYGRAKKEVPEFSWQVVRSPKKQIYAEMSYMPKGQSERSKLIIDAPRRDDEINIDADIYLFPTLDEGKIKVPDGKRFTADLEIMLNKNTELNQLIYKKE